MTMKNYAKHFDSFTEEGRKEAQAIVDLINQTGGQARIDETWLDHGQSWAWETIICKSRSLDMDYQALDPRDFEEINEGKLPTKRALEIIAKATK